MTDIAQTRTSSDSENRGSVPRILLRIFAVLLVLGFIGIGLLVSLFITLPALVSTQWFRETVQTQLSSSLKRPVRIDAIFWTWNDGINIEGLEIPDDPDYSDAPLFRMERARILLRPWDIIRERVFLEVDSQNTILRVVRNPDGTTNIEALIADIIPETVPEEPAEPEPEKESGPIRLPLDLQGSIRLTGISILAQDRVTGRSAEITDAGLRLDFPSLLTQTVRMEMGADIAIDGEALPKPSLVAEMDHLFTDDGALDLAGAVIDVKGDLPGTRLMMEGSISRGGFRGDVEIRLDQLTAAASPFLPSSLAGTDFFGRLTLWAWAAGETAAPEFEIEVKGEGLGVSGKLIHDMSVADSSVADSSVGDRSVGDRSVGDRSVGDRSVGDSSVGDRSVGDRSVGDRSVGDRSVGDRSLGPFAFSLKSEGRIDPDAGKASIESGEFRFLERSRIGWKGIITDIQTAPHADFTIAPVSMDLGEILDRVRPLFPEKMRLHFSAPPMLTVDSIHINGGLAQNPGSIELLGFDFNIPGLDANIGEMTLLSDLILFSLPEFRVELDGLNPKTAAIQMESQGGNLRASGPFSRGKPLGPFAYTFANDASYNFSEDRLTLENGQLTFLEEGRIQWAGTIQKLGAGDPQADLVAGPMTFGLKEILYRIKPLLPDQMAIAVSEKAQFQAEMIHLTGALAKGAAVVEVLEMRLDLPDAEHRSGKMPISAKGFSLSVPKMRMELQDLFPRQLESLLQMDLKSLAVDQGKTLGLRNMSMRDLHLRAEAIESSEKAPLGITGRVWLDQSLSCAAIELPGLAALKSLQENLKVEAQLTEKSLIQIGLPQFGVKIGTASVFALPYGPLSVDADFSAGVKRILLPGFDLSTVRIDGAKAALSAGKIVKLSLTAQTRGNSAASGIRTDGTGAINLSALPKNWIDKASKGGNFQGGIGFGWEVIVRIPDAEAMRKFSDPLKLDFKKDLAFLEKADLSATIDDLEISLPMEKSGPMRLGPIRTLNPLRYEFRGRSGKGEIGSAIRVRIPDLPPGKPLKVPLTLEILMDGRQEGLDSFQMNQSMTVDQLKIQQTLDLSLYGMARGLQSRGISGWLRHMGGKIAGSIVKERDGDIGAVAEGITLEGGMRAGMNIQLSPNQEVKGEAIFKSDGMDIRMGEELSVQGLRADLNLGKRYLLMKGAEGQKKRKNEIPPLSESVLRSEDLAGESGRGNENGLGNYLGQLRQRYNTHHAISFDGARFAAGPLPIRLGPMALDFNLDDGLPHADYFQLDLLGGTVMGAIAMLKGGDDFFLRCRVGFSGMDTRLFLGTVSSSEDPDLAEVAGEMALQLPLKERMDLLLSEIALDLRMTRIGPRALERLLYGLDPYESNEAIVSGRRLLRTGTPRWVHIRIEEGLLSLTGEVQAGGARIRIPPIERLNIANMGGLRSYEGFLAPIKRVTELLKKLSAEGITIAENGEVRFLD